jgi:hypothetical protein
MDEFDEESIFLIDNFTEASYKEDESYLLIEVFDNLCLIDISGNDSATDIDISSVLDHSFEYEENDSRKSQKI